MRRAAYVTPETCGMGHAVRGVALVEAAGRAGVELRAFGPSLAGAPNGYEGSADWRARVVAWAPDLLLGDIQWVQLDALRAELAVPAWLLLRWMPPGHLADRGPWQIGRWERRIAIEPIAVQDGVTHLAHPVVMESPRFAPVDGQELRAGYNTYWEAVRFGYRDRVRWTDGGSPERRARLEHGGELGALNGADEVVGWIAA